VMLLERLERQHSAGKSSGDPVDELRGNGDD
jgi:hypothetical protein